MKKGLRGLTGQNWSSALGIFIIALLLFPSSPSVLCIAPGKHVAIEDANAPCCVSSAVSLRSTNQPNAGFDRPGGCNNCTDLFLASNGNGVLSLSAKVVTASQNDGECLDTCLSADLSALLGKIGSTDPLTQAPTPVPLRC